MKRVKSLGPVGNGVFQKMSFDGSFYGLDIRYLCISKVLARIY